MFVVIDIAILLSGFIDHILSQLFFSVKYYHSVFCWSQQWSAELLRKPIAYSAICTIRDAAVHVPVISYTRRLFSEEKNTLRICINSASLTSLGR